MIDRVPKIIGLTGGIGSGKSTVAKWFIEKGAKVINLDILGNKVTQNSLQIQKELVKISGGQAVDGNGNFQKETFRALMFSDEKIRRQTETYLHPIILNAFKNEVAQHVHKPYVICEAALLIESGFYKEMDKLIVVTCPIELRKQRVLLRDKISEQLWDKILSAQTTDDVRLKLANFIIRNEGDLISLQNSFENCFRNIEK